MLAKLAKSTKYVPAFILKERYEKLAQEKLAKGKQEGVKEKEKEIVLRMREQGYNIEDIINVTGLTKAQINRIKD